MPPRLIRMIHPWGSLLLVGSLLGCASSASVPAPPRAQLPAPAGLETRSVPGGQAWVRPSWSGPAGRWRLHFEPLAVFGEAAPETDLEVLQRRARLWSSIVRELHFAGIEAVNDPRSGSDRLLVTLGEPVPGTRPILEARLLDADSRALNALVRIDLPQQPARLGALLSSWSEESQGLGLPAKVLAEALRSLRR